MSIAYLIFYHLNSYGVLATVYEEDKSRQFLLSFGGWFNVVYGEQQYKRAHNLPQKEVALLLDCILSSTLSWM